MANKYFTVLCFLSLLFIFPNANALIKFKPTVNMTEKPAIQQTPGGVQYAFLNISGANQMSKKLPVYGLWPFKKPKVYTMAPKLLWQLNSLNNISVLRLKDEPVPASRRRLHNYSLAQAEPWPLLVQDYRQVVAIFNVFGGLVCSATAIKPHYVMTAAHCITEDNFFIRWGTNMSSYGPSVPILKQYPHPDYRLERHPDNQEIMAVRNNIGILSTFEDMDYTFYLPFSDKDVTGFPSDQEFFALGFGAKHPPKYDSEKLEFILKGITQKLSSCDEEEFSFPEYACLASPEHNYEMCGKDDGGLVSLPSPNVTGQTRDMIGIVALGVNPCTRYTDEGWIWDNKYREKGKTVFIKVKMYKSFIDETTEWAENNRAEDLMWNDKYRSGVAVSSDFWALVVLGTVVSSATGCV